MTPDAQMYERIKGIVKLIDNKHGKVPGQCDNKAFGIARFEHSVRIERMDTLNLALAKDVVHLSEILAFAIEQYEARQKCLRILKRYRNETPLGHQPHMIAHEVDDLLAPTDATPDMGQEG